MGTKVSTQKSFSASVNATVDFGFGVDGIAKFGASVSGGYSNTSTDTNSQTITKGQSVEVKAAGNADGVDHGQDAFILLLNPAVAIRQSQKLNVQLNRCIPTTTNWYMGLAERPEIPPGTQVRFTVYVEWLKNPSSMPPNVAQQFQLLGFTTADYQAILALDPFANGSTTIDNARFAPTTSSFPYESPVQSSDCNNGVCNCLSFAGTIKNQFQTDNQSTSQTQYSVGFTESVSGIDIGIFNFGAKSDQKFTWTSSSTKSSTTDSSQSATATVLCPSTAYQGPPNMLVYWDKLFGSFMFVPFTLGSPDFRMLSQGIVMDASQKPLRHEPVELLIGGKTYHTWTNNGGDYAFVRPAAGNMPLPATGQLSIRGTRQMVTLGSPNKLRIRVP